MSARSSGRSAEETLAVAGRDIAISNPGKVLFPQAGYTKLDLVRYYLAVGDGALRAAGGRPNVLVRYPNGVGAEFFYQKRAPASRPAWVDVVTLRFPSGRTAEEVVPRDAAALAWMANLACLELHPHPVRAEALEHPDELRVDLDPVPGVTWEQIREVARTVHSALDDLSLVGWPKTSGSRGIHVYVRIHPRWTFAEVRRAALALARDVERRAPALATSKWWKEERHGVFLDYNQNAKDRTVAAAYSVRPTPDARVSAPLDWAEIDAQLVRVIEIVSTHWMRVQLEACEVRHPRQHRCISRHDLFRGPARRKLQLHDLDPLGARVGRTLLVEELAVDAVGVAHQHVRSISRRAQRAVGDGQVVLRHVQLGVTRLGKQHLTRIRDSNVSSVDGQNLVRGARGHKSTIARALIAMKLRARRLTVAV
ncbi:MAG TPA: non-homologous end-joining DNA ligase [Vicinamibacterales bacterium]|nr:non-homologous end-joining DNA ligase [Vicinamibacterales bacterium]